MNRALRSLLWLASGLLVACVQSASVATPDNRRPALSSDSVPQHILFVGNSFIYYNDSLHNHLRRLIRASQLETDRSFRLRSMTISGARLAEHSIEHLINAHSWDVVVMQGHSLGPIDGYDDFHGAATRFAAAIRQAGAKPALFMTWAYTDRPEMTAQLDAAYSHVGKAIDALVVPVGLAFANAAVSAPDTVLRHPDKRHPTLAGSYLAACTFYATLFGQSPVGLSYTAGLPESTVSTLQIIAWQTVQEYSAQSR